MNKIATFGYSERGLLNSLFYEIHYSKKNKIILRHFLGLIDFPKSDKRLPKFNNFKIYVEQSLSDFGDCDVIVLAKAKTEKHAFFIEAKVKTSQKRTWTLNQYLSNFLTHRKKGSIKTSSLFTQLYLKQRFVLGYLAHKGADISNVSAFFPKSVGKRIRRLGKNPVIHRFAESVRDYLSNSHFVALTPEPAPETSEFFRTELGKLPKVDLPEINFTEWGYLSWEDVEDFCLSHALVNTARVFRFNLGQIY